MKIDKGCFYQDNPAGKLLEWLGSYEDSTTANGNAGGTTAVCTGLAAEPSYDGALLKILSGPAAGQFRPIAVHAGNTLTVAVGFTDSTGAAQQITADTRFIILPLSAGGGGPGPAPEESLSYYGIVDAVPGANQFTIAGLAGLGAGKFAGATNPYQAFVLRDAGGASAAPQGELQEITAYTTATGVFATAAFTAAVAVGDEILILHPAIAAALVASVVVASGTFTTSSATVPADNTRTEGANFFRGMLLIPTAGTYINRATRIVEFTTVTGVFTVDPNNPFPGATGLVTYVVIRDQADFVPAGGGTNNRTPSDVIGMKDEVVPAMTLAPATVMTEPIVALVKAILERVGATPADPDDSLLTSLGQRDAAAALDDLSDVTTTDVEAKLRRLLLRMSGAGVFSATIQGAARTELDTMLEQLATYFVAAGAAMSLQVNGNVARTNLQQIINDLNSVFGADGLNVFNPTIQGAARTDLDAALAQFAIYFAAAGAAMSVQVNGGAARANLELILEGYFAVVGCDGANIFSTTIQGVARTTIEAAFDGLAAYFVGAGAAFSVQVQGVARTNVNLTLSALATYFVAGGSTLSVNINPGGAFRGDFSSLWNDLGQMLAGNNGIVSWPGSVAPGNGVSIAEAIGAIYDRVVATSVGTNQMKAATIDLNQAAATYDLFTGSAQAVILESLNFKCPTGAAGGALTSISIQTDDVTAQTMIDSVLGAVANLTSEAELSWTGSVYMTVATKIRLTIAGGATGGAYVCNVVAKYKAVVAGGVLT